MWVFFSTPLLLTWYSFNQCLPNTTSKWRLVDTRQDVSIDRSATTKWRSQAPTISIFFHSPAKSTWLPLCCRIGIQALRILRWTKLSVVPESTNIDFVWLLMVIDSNVFVAQGYRPRTLLVAAGVIVCGKGGRFSPCVAVSRLEDCLGEISIG
jgi:hypothetical protein